MSRMDDSGTTQGGEGQQGAAQLRETAQQVQENLRNLGEAPGLRERRQRNARPGFRHVQAAVGREALRERLAKIHGGRLSASADELHALSPPERGRPRS